MMIELAALLAPLPALVAPVELERRKSGRRSAAVAIGAVMILSDGSRCVVAGYDANGDVICAPE